MPFAKTAASITLIVAPTDTMSMYTGLPFNFLAFAYIFPFSTVTLAPNNSKPLICWSIGLAPNLQPPGIPTSVSPFLPSIEPMM